jgi:hypothetical protein
MGTRQRNEAQAAPDIPPPKRHKSQEAESVPLYSLDLSGPPSQRAQSHPSPIAHLSTSTDIYRQDITSPLGASAALQQSSLQKSRLTRTVALTPTATEVFSLDSTAQDRRGSQQTLRKTSGQPDATVHGSEPAAASRVETKQKERKDSDSDGSGSSPSRIGTTAVESALSL